MVIPHTASYLPTDNAHMEVFHKTLGFYCTLVEKGCVFSSVANFPDSGDMVKQENNPQEILRALSMSYCKITVSASLAGALVSLS